MTFLAAFLATFLASLLATFSAGSSYTLWLTVKLKFVHVVEAGKADHDDFVDSQRQFYSKFFRASCHARVLSGKSSG